MKKKIEVSYAWKNFYSFHQFCKQSVIFNLIMIMQMLIRFNNDLTNVFIS